MQVRSRYTYWALFFLSMCFYLGNTAFAGRNKDHAEIAKLQPAVVWQHFVKILDIPRGSENEAGIRQHLTDFASQHNLKTKTDKYGNLVIFKDATHGMEDRPTVILQSHMDMVVTKGHEQQKVNAFIEGDYVQADGTTLGADNGIGVAFAMAILQSDDIPHPRLQCLFTVQEEIGLKGAEHLDVTLVDGKYLINLDTMDENHIVTGCRYQQNRSSM